jgi:hypothetical protein
MCYTGHIDGLRRSDRWTVPVRSVATAAAQKTFLEVSVTPLGPGTKTTSEAQPAMEENPTQNLARLHKTYQKLTNSTTGQNHTNQEAHLRQIPQSLCTGQTSQARQLGVNSARGSTPPNLTPDLLNRSTDLHKTLGIVGTPHGHSIAKIWSTKTC